MQSIVIYEKIQEHVDEMLLLLEQEDLVDDDIYNAVLNMRECLYKHEEDFGPSEDD